jgi:hypothetical protein
LGDLFKTNYSEFDLARLFGVGTNQFNLDVSSTTTTPKTATTDMDSSSKNENSKSSKNFELIQERINSYPPILQEGDRIIIYDIIPEIAGSKNIMLQGPAPYAMTKLKKVPVNEFRAVVTGYDQKYNHYKIEANKQDLGDGIPANLTIHKGSPAEVGYFIGVDTDYYTKTIIEAPETAVNVPSTIQEETVFKESKIGEFFKPENNPIVKSFESVAGQGLAGFIKSLSFDFADARWQTEGLNNRAPMLCKVDISFAPVFDINPGIDSSGAPIGLPYNVGALMKILKISRRKSLEVAKENYNIRKRASNIASSDSAVDETDLLKDAAAGFTGG